MELDDKQKAMVEKFAWNDDDENTVRLEGDGFAKEVDECADAIIQYFLNNVSSKHYNGEEVVVPIPLTVHPLAERVFADGVSEESQGAVFNVLQHIFFAKIWLDKGMLIGKINSDVLPVAPNHRLRYTVENVWLHDNIDDDECPIVDITTDADANRNLNDLMGLGLPEDHVREAAVIQGQDVNGPTLQVEVTLEQEVNPDYDPNYDPGRSIDEGNVVFTERGAIFTEDKPE